MIKFIFMTILLLIILVVPIIPFIIAPIFFKPYNKNRWDRIYCKKCGQQYDTYELPTLGRRHYAYEEMGKTHNEKCRCHKLVRWIV